MLQDFKYAWRSLTSRPLFAAVALATLAIGIGLNTTVFSIVNVLLFKPLNVERPDQLIWISSASTKPGGPQGNLTLPDVLDLGATPVLSGITAAGYLPANVATSGQAVRVDGQLVVGNYFDVVGVAPARGRLLAAPDDRPDAPRVAVISHALWQRLFAGRDDAIGETIKVNGRAFTVIGVAPRGFRGTDLIGSALSDVWIPLAATMDVAPTAGNPFSRTSWWLRAIGRRMAPPAQTAAALAARAGAIAQAFPDSHDGFTVRVDPVRGAPPDEREKVIPLSAILLLVTLTVLLIACANVANLLLVRGMAKGRETAIRVAIGASRWRLVREQLVESAVVAAAGGAAGLLLSLWTTDILLRFAGVPVDADFSPDRTVLLFTLGVSLLTVVAFGVAPALKNAAVVPAPALKSEQGSGDARPRSRLQGALVAGQLALSMVLLLAASLFVKSLVSARSVDVGFDPRGRVSLSFTLRMHGYSPERSAAFYRSLLESVRATPGVRSASLATFVPLGGRVAVGQLDFPDRPRDPDAMPPRASINSVWPRFFDTMGIAIVRGRPLDDRDMRTPAATAVVNETMAAKYWPDRDPLGQRFSVDGADGPFVEVVGVARDTIVDEFTERKWSSAYLPGGATPDDVALLAWVDGSAGAALRTLEGRVHALDGDIAVFQPQTLQQHLADRMDGERGLSRILGVAGVLALGLAAIGLYGVVAYTVVRRTREIGIRLALGAQPADVVRLFVRDAGRLALVGVAFGIPPAIGVTVILAGEIVGVTVGDPIALAASTCVLTATALMAAYLPARRATRVDPLAALRAE
jgi:putative ABC transport system permease protein